jgi:hypothetical protein
MFRDNRANRHTGRAGLIVAFVAFASAVALGRNTGPNECEKQVEATIEIIQQEANHHAVIHNLGAVTSKKAGYHIEVFDKANDNSPILKNPFEVGCNGNPRVKLIAVRQTPEADKTYELEKVDVATAMALEVPDDTTQLPHALPGIPHSTRIPKIHFAEGENGSYAHFASTSQGILAQVQ